MPQCVSFTQKKKNDGEDIDEAAEEAHQKLINECQNHMKQAEKQRSLINSKVMQSKATRNNPHTDCVYTYIVESPMMMKYDCVDGGYFFWKKMPMPVALPNNADRVG